MKIKIRADNHENIQNNPMLFKSIKTAYNKRVASKIEVAIWQLKVKISYGLLICDCVSVKETNLETFINEVFSCKTITH